MKQKMSVTVEADTIGKIKQIVEQGLFRNKSHFIEYASNKFLQECEDK